MYQFHGVASCCVCKLKYSQAVHQQAKNLLDQYIMRKLGSRYLLGRSWLGNVEYCIVMWKILCVGECTRVIVKI